MTTTAERADVREHLTRALALAVRDAERRRDEGLAGGFVSLRAAMTVGHVPVDTVVRDHFADTIAAIQDLLALRELERRAARFATRLEAQ